jgi:hypothetical protein
LKSARTTEFFFLAWVGSCVGRFGKYCDIVVLEGNEVLLTSNGGDSNGDGVLMLSVLSLDGNEVSMVLVAGMDVVDGDELCER